jgi:hypothetical protein
MNPPLPSRLDKTTTRITIDGQPMVYTVVDQEVFIAPANPNKAFALHKLKFADGREEFRIGYYMIAQRPRAQGKWAWGQYAPMMTKEDMAAIFSRLKKKGWLNESGSE